MSSCTTREGVDWGWARPAQVICHEEVAQENE